MYDLEVLEVVKVGMNAKPFATRGTFALFTETGQSPTPFFNVSIVASVSYVPSSLILGGVESASSSSTKW